MECTTLGKEALPAPDRLPASPVGTFCFLKEVDAEELFLATLQAPETLGTRTLFFGISPHGCSDLLGRGQRGSFGRAGAPPDKALGPQLYLESSSWTLMLESHPQIITFQVLGEQNCIFIEKNKVDPFFLSP